MVLSGLSNSLQTGFKNFGMKILLTGVAGTGKSALAKELQKRGIAAVDLHDVPGMFFWQDKATKQKVEYAPGRSREWFNSVERYCNIDKLQEILNQHKSIVVAGTAGGNQAEYFTLFDKIILLHCSPEVIIHRMNTRTNKSGFGKAKSEQEDTIEWQKEFEPVVLSHGAIPLNTEGDIEKVVEKIITLLKS
jgi:dephospho-CoA kinase